MAALDGLLLFLAALNLYIVALLLLHFRGHLRGPTFELAFGACLMWRTEKGLRLMDRLSGPRAFWKAFGDAGVVLTGFAGIGVLLLLLWQFWLFLSDREIAQRAAVPPDQLLVLPGINSLIPVGYGILALAIALIFHEFMHGVLARVHGLRVKSMGLLFFIVPIGAFVEPDEEDLERAPTRHKNRVFAAGVMSNFVVAGVCAVLFSSVFWGAVAIVSPGVGVQASFPDTPAESIGLAPGAVITHVDGTPVRNTLEFTAALERKQPSETITVSYYVDGRRLTRSTELGDRYSYFEAHFPEANNESFWGRPWLGVATLNMTSASSAFPRICRTCPQPSMQDLVTLQSRPLDGGLYGLAIYISLPFGSLSPFPETYAPFYTVQGPLSALPAPLFWILLNALYWIFWLNLMVGAFNALPGGPLDGGQMFRQSLRGWLRRRYGVRRERMVYERNEAGRLIVRGLESDTQERLDRVEKTAGKISLSVGLMILALIAVPILASLRLL